MTDASVTARGRRRWAILAVGLFAQAAASVYIYGLPLLLPVLRSERHLSLTAAGFVVGAPSLGLLCTLVLWGAAADRFGERVVITSGMVLATALLLLTAASHGAVSLGVLLCLAGGAGGSVNAASGRMVMGWFSREERGLAMGIRQTAQPLGVAIAALSLPALGHHALRPPLLFCAGLCGALAVLVALLAADPPRLQRAPGQRSASPYRGGMLWRIHASSACLVVPQFAVSAFSLVYLVDVRHWSAVDAGRLIFFAQLAGAAGRIGTGIWSDRVGSRMRPMRQLAFGSTAVLGGLALGAWTQSWIVIAAFVIGAVVTVADNGLAFTAVAEQAGTVWAGRALGIQNTGQNVAAGLTPALVGALAGAWGYGWAFATVAIFPLVAAATIPVRAEAAVTLDRPCAESLGTSEARTRSRS